MMFEQGSRHLASRSPKPVPRRWIARRDRGGDRQSRWRRRLV